MGPRKKILTIGSACEKLRPMKTISIADLRSALAPVGLTLTTSDFRSFDVTHIESGMCYGPITGKKRIAACVAYVLSSGETFPHYRRALDLVHEWRKANPRGAVKA